MSGKKKRAEDKLYLCIFAMVEGSHVDKYVRKAQALLGSEDNIEQKVKSFYLETLKQYIGLLLVLAVIGCLVAERKFWVGLSVCFAFGLVAPFWDLRQRMNKRREVLRGEYVQMVIKLLMYIGAGISLRNAFEHVAKDVIGNNKESVLGMEMMLCLKWLGSGQLEPECYYRFGRRCDLPEYLRLAGLLAQNVRKGNSELILWLEKEMELAEETHRHRIRRGGERVSTKLLGPMMLLLSMVMLMIMIPALGGL